PNECVEEIRGLPNLVCLIGNHDQAALGKIPLERFNQDARAAASWTKQALSESSEAYLLSLPSRVSFDQFTLAHGSPRQPVWEYILDPQTADMNFDAFETPYCLVGHSHLPLIFRRAPQNGRTEMVPVQWEEPLSLEPRMILNPGSVGQPRDMDPRAAFAIVDTEAMTWHGYRIPYQITQVQERMAEAGLPERQAIRLLAGW
ncbi:MAG: metallophosphoesterase family protein, partial [Anaerolineales bacterium]